MRFLQLPHFEDAPAQFERERLLCASWSPPPPTPPSLNVSHVAGNSPQLQKINSQMKIQSILLQLVFIHILLKCDISTFKISPAILIIKKNYFLLIIVEQPFLFYPFRTDKYAWTGIVILQDKNQRSYYISLQGKKRLFLLSPLLDQLHS